MHQSPRAGNTTHRPLQIHGESPGFRPCCRRSWAWTLTCLAVSLFKAGVVRGETRLLPAITYDDDRRNPVYGVLSLWVRLQLINA